MGCKGICQILETKSLSGAVDLTNGFKKCNACRIRIKTEDANCPCCGMRFSLRTKRLSSTNMQLKQRKKSLKN